MVRLPRSAIGLAAAGAASGFVVVLAVAVHAIVGEVYIGCGGPSVDGHTVGGRCHALGYAVSRVLWPLFGFGAVAALLGSLAGLGIALFCRLARNRRRKRQALD